MYLLCQLKKLKIYYLFGMRPVGSLEEAPFTRPRPGHGILDGTTLDSGVRRSASLLSPTKERRGVVMGQLGFGSYGDALTEDDIKEFLGNVLWEVLVHCSEASAQLQGFWRCLAAQSVGPTNGRIVGLPWIGGCAIRSGFRRFGGRRLA
jgi:hypothetical protein